MRRLIVARRMVGAMIDFSVPAEIQELRERSAAFIRDIVVPRSRATEASTVSPPSCRDRARDTGSFAPTVPRDLGGLGLDVRRQASHHPRREEARGDRSTVAPHPAPERRFDLLPISNTSAARI
jgi:alkylation response protein AidB-like acyl-CoA dehydrogenase